MKEREKQRAYEAIGKMISSMDWDIIKAGILRFGDLQRKEKKQCFKMICMASPADMLRAFEFIFPLI